MNSLLDVAFSHHAEGRRIISVNQNKRPYLKGWDEYLERQQTEAELRQQFSNGAYGLALVLHPACPFGVLDHDGKHAKEAWQTTGIELPATARNISRSGYDHLFFRMPANTPAELRRGIRLVETACDCKDNEGKPKPCGVDFLVNGYVVMPPTPGYREDPDRPLESATLLPQAVIDLAIEKQRAEKERPIGDADGKVNHGKRKITACSLAGTMRKRGFSLEAIRAALKADSDARFNPPLEDEEIDDIMKSAADWEPGEESSRKKKQSQAEGGAELSCPYGIEDGRIVRYQTVKENTTISVPLCNFNAEIKEEIVLDDGAETHREFVIEGRLDTEAMLPEIRVMVARFPSMNWVGESWGRRAIVNAGNSTKDHLRVAIQKLSPNARDRHVFTHTGWRKIGSQWIYLSGSTTGNSGFEVDLGTELARYRMPAVACDAVDAVRLSLSLLKVAPLRITAPLLAACYRAPLCGAHPQDLSICVEGRTGSLKSTLAALYLNHFGDFNRVTLPGNWESTANHLERRAFLLKDSLFVIDEYVPTGLNRREIETKASRILRGQGNLSGRNRLKSDLTERPAFYPRGIIVSTGEEHPPGQSLLARTIVIELSRDDIDINLLTMLQQQAGRFAHAMTGYISWLTPQMDNMPQLLKETFLGTRAKATAGNEHLRIPEAAAHLWLGIHSALTYAQEIRAVDSREADQILDDCWAAFIQIGKDQTILVEEEQPVRRLLGVLHTMVTQGRAIIRDKAEAIPEPKPGVDFVGWKDLDYLYLLPEATFQAAARFCHDTGDHLPRSERLKRDLKKDGISQCDDDRLTRRVRIGDHLPRVLQLNIGVIEKMLGIEGWS